ncbi:MAG: Extracellular exo-alpha-(1-_5)-L-arabinofuranosidase ArbA [Wendovervirus sonii]|uniref:Extracellular exo-alpha-(1->5)-L-arabinofuranosidase ArbA n=1 Tax=phage Lak_Megaphage_Sonny TaxID=3109229 RepID=A0ABZ0Z3D5_9CAUD|nr:MAG: Extracellular exo-alpha-(1->5)-L-arabinofuranosidase ArbA [phage Lak_Megaphage_Sonny]
MDITHFSNPVFNADTADPTIWTDGNDYYLYYTNWWLSAPIYKSKDLIHWENTNTHAVNEKTKQQLYKLADEYKSDKCFYAPTVVKIGNSYNMYISVSWKCMVVLTSENVNGPFKFKNDEPYVLIDNNITGLNITNEDSCIAIDNGHIYLMWGSHGNLTKTELQSDGLHLIENAKFEHIAGDPENQYKVYEGLYAYKHGKYWYLFAASGQYNSYERPYNVVVGRSKSFDKPFRDKWGRKMAKGHASTILKPDSLDTYLGAGHTGEIFEDKDGKTYIAYQRQEISTSKRPLFIQQIFWSKCGWPYFKNGGKTVMFEEMPNF